MGLLIIDMEINKMIRKLVTPLLSIGLLFTVSVSSQAELIGGVEFPNGEISFADRFFDYDTGIASPDPSVQVPDYAIGIPNNQSLSLGRGGSVVLEFVDNRLTGSGDNSLDLWIFEIGPDVEDTFVEVSTDGSIWTAVGKVFGATSGIDIDAFGFDISSALRFVRLTDDPNEGQRRGFYVGADIDAVGAISTIAAPDPDPDPVNAPSVFALLALSSLLLVRKRS